MTFDQLTATLDHQKSNIANFSDVLERIDDDVLQKMFDIVYENKHAAEREGEFGSDVWHFWAKIQDLVHTEQQRRSCL